MSAPSPAEPAGTASPPDPQPPGETGPGAALRAAREAAGLTVEQVSATTRIRAGLVRDLEANRVASSGGAVYARGHVRALSRAVGIDPAPLVELLDRLTGTGPTPVTVAPPVPAPVPRTGVLAVPVSAPLERRGPQWAVAAAVASVVLIALFVVGATVGGDQPAETVRLLTAPTAAAPSTSSPPGETVPTASPPAPPAGAELAVRIVGASSWISVSSPTETVFEGLVHDGFAETFRDPEQLRLVVGNAAAVGIVCGGTDAGSLGRSGAVRKLTCGPGGLAPA